jgi:hypothetical protein
MQDPEDRSQKSEVRKPKPDVRRQMRLSGFWVQRFRVKNNLER